MVWTEEDIEKVRKFINIKNKGHYVETHELTTVYNRVLGKHVSNTSCGSCLRQRVEELERALMRYEADKAKKEAEELAFAQDSGFSNVEEARRESELIMQEIEERKKAHEEAVEEQIKEHEEAVEELTLKAELESKGFLIEEEENNNGDNTKSPKTKGRKKKSE